MTYFQPKQSVHSFHSQLVHELPMQFVLQKGQSVGDLLGVQLALAVPFGAGDKGLNERGAAGDGNIVGRVDSGEYEVRHFAFPVLNKRVLFVL